MDIEIKVNESKILKPKDIELTSLSYEDETNNDSDSITLQFLKPLIKIKDKIEVKLKKTKASMQFGKFEINKIKTDFLNKTIEAQGNLLKNFEKKQSRSFSSISIKNLVGLIANEEAYKPKCDINHNFKYIAQKDETNIQFLNRLAQNQLNAYFAIKQNNLLFLDQQKQSNKTKTTLNIKTLSALEITKTAKNKYNSCKIIYTDTKENKTKHVIEGNGKPQLIKKDLGVKDDDEALAKAKALLAKHKESEGSLTLYDSDGDNLLFAGDIIKINEVGDIPFKITKISHSITPDSHQQNASFVLA